MHNMGLNTSYPYSRGETPLVSINKCLALRVTTLYGKSFLFTHNPKLPKYNFTFQLGCGQLIMYLILSLWLTERDMSFK